MGFMKPEQPAAMPAPEMPEPPRPITDPVGNKPKRRQMTATFLGTESVPGGAGMTPSSGASGQKSLLGQ